MKKILTIVGARPQFVKAAMVSKAIVDASNDDSLELEERIIHTGQHYDVNMSDVFFREMGIPEPSKMLEFGGLSHGAMTGRMLEALEAEMQAYQPDWVLVYGDTNSTLAGAVAASKLHIPVAHVEAGLRSFNRKMPEEINRVITDHVSKFQFCPTLAAVHNLKNEGIVDGVYHVGDVMHDAAICFGDIADKRSTILSDLGIEGDQFYLSTIHRAENTDDPQRLSEIFEALIEIGSSAKPIVLPLHPRTGKMLKEFGLMGRVVESNSIRLLDPIGFLDMVMLEKAACMIFTDSGGVQKEAYFHRTPCITLRDETEWVETVKAGWNLVAGGEKTRIIEMAHQSPDRFEIEEYGAGDTGASIVRHLSA